MPLFKLKRVTQPNLVKMAFAKFSKPDSGSLKDHPAQKSSIGNQLVFKASATLIVVIYGCRETNGMKNSGSGYRRGESIMDRHHP